MLGLVSDGCDSVRRFSAWRRLSSLRSGGGGRGWGAVRFGAVGGGADDEFGGVELGSGGGDVDVERQPLGRRTSSGSSSSAGGSGDMRWVGGCYFFVAREGRGPAGGGCFCAGQVFFCVGV